MVKAAATAAGVIVFDGRWRCASANVRRRICNAKVKANEQIASTEFLAPVIDRPVGARRREGRPRTPGAAYAFPTPTPSFARTTVFNL